MSRLRPAPATLAVAVIAGLGNVAAVLALYARADYPALQSPDSVAVLVIPSFALGFIAAFVSMHTRVVSPTVVFLAVAIGTTYRELTTPLPEWSELGGYVVVDGPTHVSSYANTWYVWLALALVAGLAEFGLRRGYGIGDRRLRNLPALPLARDVLVRTVGGAAVVVGIATMLLTIRSGISPSIASIAVLAVAAVVTAVPLAALFTRGLVTPIALFALVPYLLTVEVFVTTDSPVHVLLFGPYAIVLGAAWLIEDALRSRLRGWNGGRFANRNVS